MTTGQRIRELRVIKGMTQEQLANAINIGMRSISRYENGECIPKGEIVKALDQYFGVSTDYILGITDDLNDVDTEREKIKDETINANNNQRNCN